MQDKSDGGYRETGRSKVWASSEFVRSATTHKAKDSAGPAGAV